MLCPCRRAKRLSGTSAANSTESSNAVTVCPEMSGYTLQTDVDHKGDDIAQYQASMVRIAGKCSNDINCKGFNSDGYYKKKVESTYDRPGMCLYTKNAVCPEVSGYSVQSNVDHKGSDLKWSSAHIPTAAAACDLVANCKGFNADGFVKQDVNPTFSSIGNCLYTKVASCEAVEGYSVQSNYDHSGDDIKRVTGTLANMASNCNADSGCKGFNQEGYLKSNVSNPKYTSGYCLYQKQAVCQNITDYTVEADKDHSGDDIKQVSGSVNLMAASCTADSSCKGFNSDGWLKKKVSPTATSLGKCVYSKQTTDATVYSGANYTGKSATVAVGTYQYCKDKDNFPLGDNTIMSVKVPTGYKVTLYDKCSMAASSSKVILTEDTAELGDMANSASAIVVTKA